MLCKNNGLDMMLTIFSISFDNSDEFNHVSTICTLIYSLLIQTIEQLQLGFLVFIITLCIQIWVIVNCVHGEQKNVECIPNNKYNMIQIINYIRNWKDHQRIIDQYNSNNNGDVYNSFFNDRQVALSSSHHVFAISGLDTYLMYVMYNSSGSLCCLLHHPIINTLTYNNEDSERSDECIDFTMIRSRDITSFFSLYLRFPRSCCIEKSSKSQVLIGIIMLDIRGLIQLFPCQPTVFNGKNMIRHRKPQLVAYAFVQISCGIMVNNRFMISNL
ncbi:hypothetical protein AGLY_011909 [Aphis glycines]|uniref:Uncharacterized protein n=1 Tax=Aphis glycines TaxID=307491 RepID=A0A6G0TBV1_APHGL|nr:hypothetical protein AGLY_011909 [Aphis glycines]